MVNIIWMSFLVIGITFGILSGNVKLINDTIIESSKTGLDMIVKIFPVLALWMGLMEIAEKSGLLDKMSKCISPLLIKLFPEIPKGHKSISLIASNIIANIFGLGSAATPFGLKAMHSLQELNEKKDTASRSMITFLVINTSGVTLVPTTIISLRMMYKSINPTKIVFACILGTIISTIGGIIIDKILARRYKN